MARVLVVEDEERYREVVCRYLALQGHEVVCDTSDGEEAIARGLAERPDVLVADWMLRHSVHGLLVAEALRVADPGLHTVVVTGFPASDVTVDRGRVGVAEILEKPFDVEALDGAVRRAAGESEASAVDEEEVIGVLLADETGGIRHRNRAAQALLAQTPAGAEATRLCDFLDEETVAWLYRGEEGWRRAEPDGAPVWLRARQLAPRGPIVVFLCLVSQEWRREDPRVRMLLGLPLGAEAGGVFREAMLLVDDSTSVRATFVAQLKSRGCPARSAESHAQALDVFRSDARIRIVVLDWAMPGEDLRTTVAQLREIRPEVRLVGTSGEDRSAEFAELGIDEFLLKPWTVAGELSSLLDDDAAHGPSRPE